MICQKIEKVTPENRFKLSSIGIGTMLDKLPNLLIEYLCEYLSLQEMAKISELNRSIYNCIRADLFYSCCATLFHNDKKNFVLNLSKDYQYYFKRLYPKFNLGIKSKTMCELVKLGGYTLPSIYYCENMSEADIYSNYFFTDICKYGCTDIILHFISERDEFFDPDELFAEVCISGQIKTAKALLKKCPNISLAYVERIASTGQHTFVDVAEHGQLTMVKWIKKNFSIEICAQMKAFMIACYHMHLDTAQWIGKEIDPEYNFFNHTGHLHEKYINRDVTRHELNTTKYGKYVDGYGDKDIVELNNIYALLYSRNVNASKYGETIKWLNDTFPICNPYWKKKYKKMSEKLLK